MSEPAEYAERPISAEAGADYFLRTGGGDPYASGMAYPVFLALMELYPEELGRDWKELGDRFGFIAEDAKKPAVGFHLTTDPNTGVPWLVANCQLCHAEKLHLETGDQIVSGLGNKRARPHAYGAALARIGQKDLDEDRIEELATRRAADLDVPWRRPMRAPIVHATVKGLRAYAAKQAPAMRFASALPGRMATIESFALALGAKVPDQPIGWAKVPDVRSFPYRETFSYDASGYGSPQALVLDADFLFGARPEWYLAHPHIATSMLLYLRSFQRKLPFPGRIDGALAEKGHAIFDDRCASCHGFYVKHGDEMRVSYKERVVPLDVIGTDPARALAVTDDFVRVANDFPLTRGHARVRRTGGYVPPVLLDVWARGLYGHAGQWPSLAALAMKERPRRVVIDTKGLYDLERVGVRYTDEARAPRAGEYVLEGISVDGHLYLAKLPSDDQRAVIEYLKTL